MSFFLITEALSTDLRSHRPTFIPLFLPKFISLFSKMRRLNNMLKEMDVSTASIRRLHAAGK
jgi:hypothetical protein